MNNLRSKLATISVLLLVGVMTVLADGKNLKDSISIPQQTVVKDTKLKPGKYEARFDAETNEVSILKDGKVVVTVKATAQSGEAAVRKTETYFSSTEKGLALTKLVFKGDDRAILLHNGNGSVAAGQ